MRIKFDKYVIEVCEGVYEPAEDSFALIDAIDIVKPRGSFLDLGSGTGIVGIHTAVNYGVELVMSDINPLAVRCSKRNAQLNGIHADVIYGDLMDRLREIDYVAFNPPYLKGIPSDVIDMSWSYEFSIDRFIRQLGRVRKGAILLTTAFNDNNRLRNIVLRNNMKLDLLLHRIAGGEEYFVWHVYASSRKINLNR